MNTYFQKSYNSQIKKGLFEELPYSKRPFSGRSLSDDEPYSIRTKQTFIYKNISRQPPVGHRQDYRFISLRQGN